MVLNRIACGTISLIENRVVNSEEFPYDAIITMPLSSVEF